MDKNNVIEQYKEIAKTYSSFDDCYKLVTETNNVEICKFCLDSDGIWKRLELKWMLDFFQNNEDYEKCNVLKKLIDEHFIADEPKQNELNKINLPI
jgi:serine/threonine protein phosphatase PrpC